MSNLDTLLLVILLTFASLVLLMILAHGTVYLIFSMIRHKPKKKPFVEYPCWFCGTELMNKKHYFSWEFDTPICKTCMDKLKNDKDFNNHDEGTLIRKEFNIK